MAEGEVFSIDTSGALKALDSILSKNLDAKKDLKKLIRASLKTARKSVVAAARAAMPNDPRKSYQAVRSSVYKRIFGGQVNILASKKASAFRAKVSRSGMNNGVGGNRRTRSARTEQLAGYWGKDRGFVLRFLNAGTKERKIRFSSSLKNIVNPGSHGGHSDYRNRKTGNRGVISARNWFKPAAESGMQQASEQLVGLIDRAIYEVWNEQS